MWRSIAKVAAATALFGVVHSALASRTAKQTATHVLGERNRNGLYRVFYIAQSTVTLGALAAYIRRQPSRELYRVEGRWALAMHAGQIAALVYATAAARQIGVGRVTGMESFGSWLGEGDVPPEPEAQGPALDAEGRQCAAGPFAWSRHPLNFVAVPALWLWPRMTTNLMAFNFVATAYAVLGSLHEEARLKAAAEDAYGAYQRSGVPFFLPVARHGARQPTQKLLERVRP